MLIFVISFGSFVWFRLLLKGMAWEKALQELGKGREWQQSKETNYLSVIHVTFIIITLYTHVYRQESATFFAFSTFLEQAGLF